MNEQEKIDSFIKAAESTFKAAESAFWECVVENYPTATSGDLSPDTSYLLERAMRDALAEWIDNNVPLNALKTVEILLHDIEYHYRLVDISITETDKEHIAYCISQGIREGELASSCIEGSDEIHYGWWSIKK